MDEFYRKDDAIEKLHESMIKEPLTEETFSYNAGLTTAMGVVADLDPTIIVEGKHPNWTIESAVEYLQNCGWMAEHDKALTQQWIPVSKAVPEKIETVNITFVNHDPAPYYQHLKDVPLTASGVFCNGKWFWDSVDCADYCRIYGFSMGDEMDEAIEVTAWCPLPDSYKEETDG